MKKVLLSVVGVVAVSVACVFGFSHHAEASSSSGGSGIDKACARQCLGEYCATHGLPCDANNTTMDAVNAIRAAAECKARCSR